MPRDGTIQCDGPWLKLAGHAARLTLADQRLWERIDRVMKRAGFHPPRVRDVAALFKEQEEEVRHLMQRLARMGVLVEIARDHFYDRARVADLARVAII